MKFLARPLALLALAACAFAQGTNFQSPQRFAVASDPRQVLLADLNHDAKLDAIVLSHSGTVTVFLNNGTSGYFATPKTFTTISNPVAIAVADFNHDSKPDLVVLNATTSQIYLGKGDGTFTTGASYNTVSGVNQTIVAVDVNKDSLPDLIIGTSTEIDFLRGNGDGTFAAATTVVSSGVNAGSTLAVADVNRDGSPDILAEQGAKFGIALGNGNGTFQSMQFTTLSGTLVGLTVADFNHDGNLDVIAAGNALQSNGSTAGVLNVFTGDGNGTFKLLRSLTYPARQISSLASGDFDKDGRLDLLFTVTTNSTYNPAAMILFGDGNGGFGNLLEVPTSNLPAAVAVGDVDRDGWLDFVAVENPANDLAVFRNNILPPTALAQNFPVAIPVTFSLGFLEYPPEVTLGDFNHDGKLDAAITGGSSYAQVLFGDGKGNFALGPLIDSGTGNESYTALSGDFDNDGNLDLEVTIPGAVIILLGNGDGTFRSPLETRTSESTTAPMPTTMGDFNHDGVLDVAVSYGNSIELFFGQGDGTFPTFALYPIGTSEDSVISMQAVDCNNDGNLDLAFVVKHLPVSGTATYSLQVMLGNPDGTLNSSVVEYPILIAPENAGGGPFLQFAIGDLNRDGIQDLVIPDDSSGVLVFLGKGDGTFYPPVDYVVGSARSPFNPYNLQLIDTNGDGKLDIISVNSDVAIWMGNGDGTFQAPIRYLRESEWGIAGDFRNSGHFDLLDTRELLFNGGAVRQTISSSLNPASPGNTVLLSARVVNPAGAVTPTGSLTFLDGTTILSTVTLDSTGSASLSTSFTTAGSHRISTQYSGDGNYFPSTASTLTEIIENNPTTVSLASSLNPSNFGQSVTFTATVTAQSGTTPTGAVNFIGSGTVLATAVPLNGSGKATLSTTTLPAGVPSITAFYSGNASFGPSLSAPLQQTVVGTSTTTAVTSSLNPSIYGNAVTLTATVTATGGAIPTGSVNFIANNTVVATGVPLDGTGKAHYTTSALPAGVPSITAFYRGNGAFTQSLSPAFNQTVYQGLQLSTNSQPFGDVVDGSKVTLPVMLTNPNPSQSLFPQLLPAGRNSRKPTPARVVSIRSQVAPSRSHSHRPQLARPPVRSRRMTPETQPRSPPLSPAREMAGGPGRSFFDLCR